MGMAWETGKKKKKGKRKKGKGKREKGKGKREKGKGQMYFNPGIGTTEWNSERLIYFYTFLLLRLSKEVVKYHHGTIQLQSPFSFVSVVVVGSI